MNLQLILGKLEFTKYLELKYFFIQINQLFIYLRLYKKYNDDEGISWGINQCTIL